MLDGADASIREELLWPVVDELSVDETVDAVCLDALNLGLHLLALSLLQLSELACRVDLDPCTEDLDLVRVHGCVGNQNLCVFYPLWLVHTELLVQDESLVQVRVLQLSASLFDDLNVREVGRSPQLEDGVDGKFRKL